MDYETLKYEVSDGVATITLNRPKVLNAINQKMEHELDDAFDQVASDKDARALILKGEGRAFSAGYDLKEEAVDVVAGPSEWFDRFAEGYDTFLKVWRMQQPVIASVHGYCLGGVMDLMLLCDIVIVSEGTVFGYPEVRHASTGPGIGLLLYSIGSLRKAKELLMLGDSFDADEALEMGLINWVVPAEKLDAVVSDTARRMSLIPKSAMSITKLYVNRMVEAMGFDQSVPYAVALSSVLTGSEEYRSLEKMRGTMGPEQLKEFFRKRDAEFERRA